MRKKDTSIFDKKILKEAFINSFKKLNPFELFSNPVMLAVEIGGLITTLYFIYDLISHNEHTWFSCSVSLWLWLTVLFSNFAESLAESRGKARAQTLRESRTNLFAKKLKTKDEKSYEIVPATSLKKGDLFLLEKDDIVPIDGELLEGVLLVNEAAVTGESAPVVREAGTDKSSVTAGTKVVSGVAVAIATVNPGETFVDKMISLVEGAKRRKTPNEIALNILLIFLTVVFLAVVINFRALSYYSVYSIQKGSVVDLVTLVALFVCLAPTTIAALLPAIGIAGMDRLFRRNIIALSGRAIEAAGDVNVLLLDKTGTITYGDRQAYKLIPVEGVSEEELAYVAHIASLGDKTAEGKSIYAFTKEKYNMSVDIKDYKVIEFDATTRITGVDIREEKYRKGAFDAITKFVSSLGGTIPRDLNKKVEEVAKEGGTPLVVAKENKIYGVVYLKDIIKPGIKEKFSELRRAGIKTVMITGDNPLTAATIAAEAGVDEFLAEAKPEDKLNLIKKYQEEGYIVAMTGDGTNDAPALAQADVAVAMNSGTQAAKEAANIIDLDNDPSKLIAVVEVGKEILITRGAITTFSIANDIAKYFVIIPAAASNIYPELNMLNILHLADPYIAILSAVIFNAIVIPMLIPLALKGVKYKPMDAQTLLVRNLSIYGVGGILFPFLGIWIIYWICELIGRML
ncbi:MAG: potassium-transporting ATPase subunit KdpB [Thermodesulfobacterium sp.]|jgi:K+-transporting ATPase ATPase B chain|nr:potassium-transporting ATPase subunit KdpB [Thermodesulfobacterium sp.]